MSEANLSKGDLEDICRRLGLSTKGVKADLRELAQKTRQNNACEPPLVVDKSQQNLGLHMIRLIRMTRN